jgi:hypothetical protein
VKLKNNKNNQVTNWEWCAPKTPAKIGPSFGFDHVGVKWPDGTLSEWKFLDKDHHFVKQEIKAPEFWNNARPFEKIEKGFFYQESSVEADYKKPGELTYYGVPENMGMLGFSDGIRNGFSVLEHGRLEDKYVYYKYCGLLETERETGYNRYARKHIRNIKETGVYFDNTSSYESHNRIEYKTTPAWVAQEPERGVSLRHDLNIPVTEDLAYKLGRAAVRRIYFTIEDDTNPQKHTSGYNGYWWDYALYKATFHGVQIIYQEFPQLDLTAIFKKEYTPE